MRRVFVEHWRDHPLKRSGVITNRQSRRLNVEPDPGGLGHLAGLVRKLSRELDEHNEPEQLDERAVQPDFRAGPELSAIQHWRR